MNNLSGTLPFGSPDTECWACVGEVRRHLYVSEQWRLWDNAALNWGVKVGVGGKSEILKWLRKILYLKSLQEENILLHSTIFSVNVLGNFLLNTIYLVLAEV